MAGQVIPLELKRDCVAMKQSGIPMEEVYATFCERMPEPHQSYSTFLRSVRKWSSKVYPDDTTLKFGTFEGFTAHGATVRVNADGEITEAWIKQKADEFDYEAFLDGVRADVPKYTRDKISQNDSGTGMLEIPLFDMHWGIMAFQDYVKTCDEILSIIESRDWDEINILVGQDLFHNDSLEHGVTSNGTPIEKVNIRQAVLDARKFFGAIIETALERSNRTKVIYTVGNHDRTVSWMFTEILKERFSSDVVDDSIQFRKCITYGANAIMITHGDSKRSTPANLASIFPVAFPVEFANATCREVHAGHLHHEGCGDIFGTLVRRLSTGVSTDTWSDMNDYVGSAKRFMLFHWSKEALKGIYYV